MGQNHNNVKRWGKNAKVLVATEILWAVPMSWVFFYQTIFMRQLGLSEVLIGFCTMLPLACQMVFPMFGGHLADRFGRKRVLMTFDVIGWMGSITVWFLSTEAWHIIIAMLFQGLTTTIYGVWEALLVEDTEPNYRGSIYSYLQSTYIVGGLLTPIGGALVSIYGVEQGCRSMFLIFLLFMIVAFSTRQKFLRESNIGKMLAMSDGNDSQTSRASYSKTLREIGGHKTLIVLFILNIIGTMEYTLYATFRPLFLSDPRALALNESIISIVPMISSISSLIVLSFIIPRLGQRHYKMAIFVSYILGILGIGLLVTAPMGSLLIIAISAVLDSARTITTVTILRVILVNTIDEVNPFGRARIMSLMITLSAIFTWPMPMIGGFLYSMSPPLPFLLSATILIIGSATILMIRPVQEEDVVPSQ